ncbi:MAG: acyltransferase family protein, partial [Methylotenera sp.]
AGFQSFSGGFVGVDVFFVISGYLITSILLAELEAGRFSILNFYERRARRILPALFFVMLICIPFAWLWLLPQDMKTFTRSLIAVAGFVSNIYFWQTSGYFETAAELKPLLHTWSLAVEEQYYLFFPIFLMFTWKYGKRWIFATLIVIALLSLALAQWGSVAKPDATFYLLPTRVWELLIGALLALNLAKENQRHFSKVINEIIALIGLLLLIVAIFLFNKQTPFPGFYALMPTIGTALIIFCASSQTFVGRLLGHKYFVGIGLISYSAYLWHQPLYAFARYNSADEPSKWLFISLTVAAIVLAYFSWKYIERPFRDKRRYSRRQIFAFSASGIALFVAFGLAGHITKGFQPSSDNKIELPWLECDSPQMVNGLCMFGNFSASETIVLVGDSHLAHLSKAILTAFGDRYRIVYISCGSCFFGENLRFDNLAYDVSKLKEARNQIALLKDYNIKAVIRGQRWHGYGIDTENEIVDAVEDSIHFFGVPYGKMIIVGSTQDIDYRCHVGKHLKSLVTRTCKSFPESTAINENFLQVTRKLAGKSKLHFVYPYERLCSKGECLIFSGSEANYIDNHHLSKRGASFVMEDIRKQMDN